MKVRLEEVTRRKVLLELPEGTDVNLALEIMEYVEESGIYDPGSLEKLFDVPWVTLTLDDPETTVEGRWTSPHDLDKEPEGG